MSLRKGQTNSGSFKKGEHRSPKTEFKKGVSIKRKVIEINGGDEVCKLTGSRQ
jgi:hypothetical protein